MAVKIGLVDQMTDALLKLVNLKAVYRPARPMKPAIDRRSTVDLSSVGISM